MCVSVRGFLWQPAGFVLLVSGLHVGGTHDPLLVSLLVDFVAGYLGGQEDQEGTSARYVPRVFTVQNRTTVRFFYLQYPTVRYGAINMQVVVLGSFNVRCCAVRCDFLIFVP